MKYIGGIYMKISGKEAYSVMLSDSPDIMNIEEMCSALSISKKTGYKKDRGYEGWQDIPRT